MPGWEEMLVAMLKWRQVGRWRLAAISTWLELRQDENSPAQPSPGPLGAIGNGYWCRAHMWLEEGSH